MTTLLQCYEKQYGVVSSEITANLSGILRVEDDERRNLIQKTSRLFDEGKDVLEQMTLESHELMQEERSKYTNRIDIYGKELNRLLIEFRKPKYSLVKPSSRLGQNDPLTGDDESLLEDVLYDTDMRAALLGNNDRAARSAGRLDDGVKVAIHTEEVGGQILTDLHDQRSKLQRSRDRLRRVDSDLNKSSRILYDMTRRILKNRIVLIGIIFVMILIFIVAVYAIIHRRYPAPVDIPSIMPVKDSVPEKTPV